MELQNSVGINDSSCYYGAVMQKKKKKKKKKGLKIKKLHKAWTKKVKHKPQRKLIRISFKITTAVQIARICK